MIGTYENRVAKIAYHITVIVFMAFALTAGAGSKGENAQNY